MNAVYSVDFLYELEIVKKMLKNDEINQVSRQCVNVQHFYNVDSRSSTSVDN